MAKAALTFALYRGDALVKRVTIAEDIIKVGQDEKSHLRVDDPGAGRMHAVIEVASTEEVSIIDLGNDPPTQVNGNPVSKSALAAGDEILVGAVRLVLEKIEDPAVAAAQPAEPAKPAAPPRAANPFAASPEKPSSPFGGGGSSPFAAPAAAPSPFGSPAGSNPFAAAAASSPFASAAASSPFGPARTFGGHGHGHGEDLPEGTYTYRLLKSGPEPSRDEVEHPNVQSCEVMVLWETNVLSVTHLTPPRNFFVGEGTKPAPVDFELPSEVLKTSRMPVVLSDGRSVTVVLPAGCSGTIEEDGKDRLQVSDVFATAPACSEVAGAKQYTLAPGGKAKVHVGKFVFQVSAVKAGKKAVASFGKMDLGPVYYVLGTAASAALILGALVMGVPDAGQVDESAVSKDQLILMKKYLDASAEREQEEKETEQVAEANADNKEGGTGTRAKGEEGSMGNPNTKATGMRYGVKGPKDNPDPHIARAAALREAREFGMIGLLSAGGGGDPDAPTAPWGRDTSLGTDEMSARGNMWGDEIGDAFGAGGLGLSGIGEGGGGRGEGIGLGSIGSLGHGSGTGTGQGIGSGHGRLSGKHKAAAPQVRLGATTVTGRLPPDVIRRIVRQNFGRFRMCYEQGLGRNPNLEGRVVVGFIISAEGAVSSAQNAGSDLPDAAVVSCVVSAFYGLGFPKPEGGIVSVTYPISFSPG